MEAGYQRTEPVMSSTTPRTLKYDVHTHVGADHGFYLRGWWPYACTVQDLLQHMNAGGIDRAVCFPFTMPSAFDVSAFADRGKVELLAGRVPFDRENALLVQEVQRIDLERRLFPLAMFDPGRCVQQQLPALERLAPRVAGLKTQTTILESPIRALLGDARELMALAEQYDLPVLMHTAVYAQDPWAQVADCLDVAAAYPKVRFDLAHSLRFHAAHLKVAAQLPNVWVDCSAHLAQCALACEKPDSPFVASTAERVPADYSRPADVLTAIHELLGGRYMWGSDNPFMSWTDDIIRVVFSYRDEVDVLDALSAGVRADMAGPAPERWLFGTKRAPTATGGTNNT